MQEEGGSVVISKGIIWAKTRPDAVPIRKAHKGDVGYDLTLVQKVKEFNECTALYDTGIRVKPYAGFYVEIHPRSSISKTGYILANSTGIIDPEYTGNLLVALTKVVPSAPELTLPCCITQLVVRKKYDTVDVEFSAENMDAFEKLFSESERGSGGFGSTNKE